MSSIVSKVSAVVSDILADGDHDPGRDLTDETSDSDSDPDPVLLQDALSMSRDTDADIDDIAADWVRALDHHDVTVEQVDTGPFLPMETVHNIQDHWEWLETLIENEMEAAAKSGYPFYSPTGRLQKYSIEEDGLSSGPEFVRRQLVKEQQTSVPHPNSLEVHQRDQSDGYGSFTVRPRQLKNADAIERGITAYDTFDTYYTRYCGMQYIRIWLLPTPSNPSVDELRDELHKHAVNEDDRVSRGLNAWDTNRSKQQTVTQELTQAEATLATACEEIADNATTRDDPYYSEERNSAQYDDIEL